MLNVGRFSPYCRFMSEGSIIALVLRESRVEWTALQHRKHRAEISQQKSVPLDWPEGLTDHRSPEAATFLKGKLPPLKGSLGIAIPSDRVLMRIIELPSVDTQELLGMAELQVDKFSPFPTDQMALAIEVLHQTEESSRVLIAAVQHDYIDHLGEFLMNAGLYPQSVDVDVLGWWTLIRDEGRLLGSGQEAVVIHDDACAQLIMVRDGVPLVIRALDTGIDLEQPAFAREISDELEYTLMTLEGSWGAAETQRLTFWTMGRPSEAVVAELRRALPLEVMSADLNTLPPLSEGLSRRLSSPESASLDLAPAGWRRGIQSKQFQRRALVIAGASFGVWLLFMAGLFYWSNHQKTRLAKSQTAIVRLGEEVEAVRTLRGQVEWLQQYADRTYSSLECLREISELLPAGVEITSITYNKASQVNLRGEADSDGPVNDFIAQLEKSALFTEVKTEGISTAQRGGRTRSQFRITMMLPSAAGAQES